MLVLFQNMKVNSFAANVETPVKKVAEESANLLEEESESVERCSPSSELQSLLKRIVRIHKFRHSPVVKCIEKIKLSLKIRNELRSLFDGFDYDESDWIIELEANCTESGQFSAFVRKYISFEFRVQLQYSFCVFLLLNYMKEFSLDAETAFVDIFKLKVENTFCSSCSASGMSILMIEKENLNYLKKVYEVVTNVSFEDSDCDPDFDMKNCDDIDSSSVETCSDDEMSKNKLVRKERTNKEELHHSNPFVSDDDSNDVYRFSEELDCNPFVTTGGDDLDYQRWKFCTNSNKLDVPKMSSVKDKTRMKVSKCDHCEGQFKSNYNLKLHMIQVHRIFFDDVTVYDCPEYSCKFVTGSRICYNRHAATHIRKPKIKVNSSKVQCRNCPMVLANMSSLRRHEKRKHKED